MGYFENYQERVLNGASSRKERTLSEMQRSFAKYLKESPTCIDVLVTHTGEYPHIGTMHQETVSINDFSENDQSKLDEKILKVRHDLDIEIGCYLQWEGNWWLVTFNEHKSAEGFRKFIIRRCNQILRYGYKGKVYELPISIENLTMYSDGIADEATTSVPDSKRQIWYGYNDLVKVIDIGTRVMLTNRAVFRITHINDFEYNGGVTGTFGLIKALILETATISDDDEENNVAWNPEFEEETRPYPSTDAIMGEKLIRIGTTLEYYTRDDALTLELAENYDYCTLSKISSETYSLEVSNVFKNIGKVIELVLKDTDGSIIDRRKIFIRG